MAACEIWDFFAFLILRKACLAWIEAIPRQAINKISRSLRHIAITSSSSFYRHDSDDVRLQMLY